MTRALLILGDALTACTASAKIALMCADRNWDAALGWSIALLWIFISMFRWIDDLLKGEAEAAPRHEYLTGRFHQELKAAQKGGAE